MLKTSGTGQHQTSYFGGRNKAEGGSEWVRPIQGFIHFATKEGASRVLEEERVLFQRQVWRFRGAVFGGAISKPG